MGRKNDGFRLPRSRSGFTIVELLVVTAILAVLAALLLPSLRLAKEKGKAADCMNNLRQIYIAFAMHADDNDDYFPYTYYWWRILGADGYLGKGEWHGYHTTTWYAETRWPVFRCAAEKGVVFNTSDPNCRQPNPLTTAYDSDLDHCSYAFQWSINQYCGYYAGYCGVNAIYPRQGFSKPTDNPGGRAAAPLVMDKYTPYFGWIWNGYEWSIDTPDPYNNGGYCPGWMYAFRHPGHRANVLYLDGHVDTIRPFSESGIANWVNVWNAPPFEP